MPTARFYFGCIKVSISVCFLTSSMDMESYLLLSLGEIDFLLTVCFEMFYGVATSTPAVHFLSRENNSAEVYYSPVILFVTLAL